MRDRGTSALGSHDFGRENHKDSKQRLPSGS
jgi:hypothetical protein